MSGKPRILMCSPEFFGIEYEINPWMSREQQVDHPLAVRQWQQLHDLLASLGAQIEPLEPVRGWPDLVFTANAGMIYRERVIVSHFRHPQRQGEEPLFAAWFEQHGWEIVKLPPGDFFEGAGDALFCGDTLIAGYCTRSDMRSQQHVASLIGHRVIALELVNPHFYHLDTCFCPLAPGVAIYHPGAFDSYCRQALAACVDELLEVDEEEAVRFACNAVVVGQHVVTNTGCPRLHALLRRRGFTPLETPLSEFVKAGGSAKCLTLRLDGEEAAAWKPTPAV